MRNFLTDNSTTYLIWILLTILILLYYYFVPFHTKETIKKQYRSLVLFILPGTYAIFYNVFLGILLLGSGLLIYSMIYRNSNYEFIESGFFDKGVEKGNWAKITRIINAMIGLILLVVALWYIKNAGFLSIFIPLH